MVNWLLDWSIYPTVSFLVSSTGQIERTQTIYSKRSPHWQNVQIVAQVCTAVRFKIWSMSQNILKLQWHSPYEIFSSWLQFLGSVIKYVWTVTCPKLPPCSLPSECSFHSILQNLPTTLHIKKVIRSLTYQSKDPPTTAKDMYLIIWHTTLYLHISFVTH